MTVLLLPMANTFDMVACNCERSTFVKTVDMEVFSSRKLPAFHSRPEQVRYVVYENREQLHTFTGNAYEETKKAFRWKVSRLEVSIPTLLNSPRVLQQNNAAKWPKFDFAMASPCFRTEGLEDTTLIFTAESR